MASEVEVPGGGLAFARAAAGFWKTTLSPIHGATWPPLARGGVTPPLRLVDRVVERDGSRRQPAAAPAARHRRGDRPSRRAHDGADHAIGTARGFRDKRGPAPAARRGRGQDRLAVGEADPYLAYSWFVGYAPAERPKVAFAVVLGNNANWRIKATYVGRHIVSEYVADEPATAPRLLAAK